MNLADRAWALYVRTPLPNGVWLLPVRFLFYLLGRRINVTYSRDLGLFRLIEGETSVYTARRKRIRLFHRGVQGRLTFLADSYSIPSGTISKNDIVIDCGANIGEFSIAMESEGAIVHAFEPNEVEYAALELNLRGSSSRAWPLGCASSTGWAFLAGDNEDGDSKLVEVETGIEVLRRIPTTTLDDWADEHLAKDSIIKVLKLEAEGDELAVLLGANKTLKRTLLVCADLGEAHQSADNAVAPVTNLLLGHGFTMLSFSKNRCMTVFVNSKLRRE